MRVRTIKPWWLIAAFLSGLAFAMAAEDLILSTEESRLEFSAPRVHFLVGKPLERLRNASEVPFDFKITLWSGTRNHLLREVPARFVVSYDLWEEKFSVTRLLPTRRTARHLTDIAAEAWCLQQMSQDVTGVSATEPLWARLEIRAQDGKEAGLPFGRGNITDSGISLTSLIEILSRPAATTQPHWTIETGPVTLEELRRGRRRG
ncbi:MAG TPA: hypothetical protein VE958_17935 [Bryobacteraceae bacterium]|jgi:hypothetical protein|nr:hypothetical protein [Bryobacteraceae bacterium]